MLMLSNANALWSEGLWNMLSQRDNFTWKWQNLYSKMAIFSNLPKKFSRFLNDGSTFKMAALTLSVPGGMFFHPPIVNLMPFFCGVEFFFQLLMIFYVGDFNTSQCSQTFDLLLNILRNSAKKVSNPSLFWLKIRKSSFFGFFLQLAKTFHYKTISV